ncbi:unnamed protein product [Polarella glacialis]|uniref:Methyltransferase domain-containing protein n=1 Tax=Polarella glacialis TaxID=89957 RepID=A0A813FHM2_POLGL|nr:unnamed protein product [Polarella glacialis]CAE8651104.1 unnamed protein product [Polarella glacialis]CAE8682881.1 unnamed protein product [Polarella glacialis]|mmetsp:Transcript_83845/g.151292  ORF Transcript_83845/g.151292 Transcript_83845/m.151292 type:complete len:274 (-) Transcript_83845:230-1051(-)
MALLSIYLSLSLSLSQISGESISDCPGSADSSTRLGASLLQSSRHTHLSRNVSAPESALQGCDAKQDYFDDFQGNSQVADESANRWHYSDCARSKSYVDTFTDMVKNQSWKLQPSRILSFGCSVGFEPKEVKARFPEAEVWGYDLDAETIETARRDVDPQYNITFTSDRMELRPNSFEVVLINNVLYSYMSPGEFREFLRGALDLVHPGGVLELTIFDDTRYCTEPGARGAGGYCEDYAFQEHVAWDVLAELLPNSSASFKLDYPSYMFVHRA